MITLRRVEAIMIAAFSWQGKAARGRAARRYQT
jgi:hypothetical protein